MNTNADGDGPIVSTAVWYLKKLIIIFNKTIIAHSFIIPYSCKFRYVIQDAQKNIIRFFVEFTSDFQRGNGFRTQDPFATDSQTGKIDPYMFGESVINLVFIGFRRYIVNNGYATGDFRIFLNENVIYYSLNIPNIRNEIASQVYSKVTNELNQPRSAKVVIKKNTCIDSVGYLDPMKSAKRKWQPSRNKPVDRSEFFSDKNIKLLSDVLGADSDYLRALMKTISDKYISIRSLYILNKLVISEFAKDRNQ